MSAASPKIQDKTAEKAHEPSMEEILASIRRIIADDQAAKPADSPPPKPAPPPDPEDVLDLAEFAEPAESPAKPAPLDLDPIDFGLEAMDFDAIVVEPDPEPEPEPAPPPVAVAPPPPPPAQPARAPEPAPEPEPLISAQTDASVGSAFNMLAHTVLSRNARTLDDLVADMLRPMLKAWLDDNLPVMVDRLVRAEIERVSRGR